jgi:hypothetical protein
VAAATVCTHSLEPAPGWGGAASAHARARCHTFERDLS